MKKVNGRWDPVLYQWVVEGLARVLKGDPVAHAEYRGYHGA